MILEAGKRVLHSRVELALEKDVADHPLLARHGLEWEKTDSRETGAAEVSIRTTEELVPAANREHRGAARCGSKHALRLPREIARNERLLAVLSAAHVQEVVLAGPHGDADTQLLDVQLVTAPRGAPREHRDVAAVRVDVQVIGIEMPDAQPHAARSQ